MKKHQSVILVTFDHKNMDGYQDDLLYMKLHELADELQKENACEKAEVYSDVDSYGGDF